MQLNTVIDGIDIISTKIKEAKEQENDDIASLNAIKKILESIKNTAQKQNANYSNSSDDFYALAQQFGTHYVPFNQSNDPFKGSDFGGYCWEIGRAHV